MRSARTIDAVRPYVDLLDRPAIFADVDGPAHRRVRARLGEIQRWFAERADWTLIATRELVRLEKQPAQLSSGHGFRWAKSALDYELLVWCLWFAEGSGEEQFLLTQLIEEIEARAAELLGPGHLNWDDYTHRLALNRALGGLEELGALRRIDRDADDWVLTRSGDALYEFTPLARYLNGRWPAAILGDWGGAARPPDLERLHRREPLPGPATPEQRLYRTLLLEPALYRFADPEAFELLARRERRERIGTDLADHTGWDLEVTESYACLLRPSASSASEQNLFPFRGALCHVLLLLSGYAREQVATGALAADAFDCVHLSSARLVSLLTELRERHGESWSRAVAELGASSLAEVVISALHDWSLLDGPDADGQMRLLPLAAPFRGAYRAQTEEGIAWL